MSEPLRPGLLIGGRYQLDRLIGQGGMGQVWAAIHTVTGRRAALKFLRGGPTHNQPEMRRRFLREARAASAVVHPNVVQVQDFFELPDGTPVMVMDLLEGESLAQRLSRVQTLELKEAVDVLLPVISAVGTAHSLGVVHRDLKPDNVFLVRSTGPGADVRVLDFGIAKLTSASAAATDAGALTDTGALLGTPCYMSPEQSFGERDIDHRTDVWAIGVMLYEMLSGTRPVDGENMGQVLKRLMTVGITPIEVLVPDLPGEVAALVGRMLARDRDVRPSDLREVSALLSPFGSVSVQQFGAAVSERPALDSSDPGSASDRVVVAQKHTTDPEADTHAAQGPASAGTHGAQSISVTRTRRSALPWAAGLVAVTGAVVLVVRGFMSSGPAAAASGGIATDPAPPVVTFASAPATPSPPTSSVDSPSAVAPPAPSASAEAAIVTPAAAARAPQKGAPPRGAPAPQKGAEVAAPPTTPVAAPPAAPAKRGGLVDEPPF
jgi:eukaryotic-like serine/threonine-protein kinase